MSKIRYFVSDNFNKNKNFTKAVEDNDDIKEVHIWHSPISDWIAVSIWLKDAAADDPNKDIELHIAFYSSMTVEESSGFLKREIMEQREAVQEYHRQQAWENVKKRLIEEELKRLEGNND